MDEVRGSSPLGSTHETKKNPVRGSFRVWDRKQSEALRQDSKAAVMFRQRTKPRGGGAAEPSVDEARAVAESVITPLYGPQIPNSIESSRPHTICGVLSFSENQERVRTSV